MIQHRTKHFLAVAILVAGTLAAYAAFPTKENWELVNPDETIGNWDSFKFNWIGMNDQHVTLVLSNSAGYVSVTNYFVQVRLSKAGTIYTEVNNANITKTVTSVAFQVAATNIGPVDTYQAEVFCWEGASTNLARTLAQGKVLVSKSLYSDTNAFPFPASLTNLSEYLTIAAAAATYAPIAASPTNAIPRTEAEATNAIFRAGIALAQAGVVSNGAYLVEQGSTNSTQNGRLSVLETGVVYQVDTNGAEWGSHSTFSTGGVSAIQEARIVQTTNSMTSIVYSNPAAFASAGRVTVVETGKVDKASTNGWIVTAETDPLSLHINGDNVMTSSVRIEGADNIGLAVDMTHTNSDVGWSLSAGPTNPPTRAAFGVYQDSTTLRWSWETNGTIDAQNTPITNLTLAADGTNNNAVRYSQLGNAAFSNGAAFASAADGVLAQSAVQPATLAATGTAWRAEWQNAANLTNYPTAYTPAQITSTASNVFSFSLGPIQRLRLTNTTVFYLPTNPDTSKVRTARLELDPNGQTLMLSTNTILIGTNTVTGNGFTDFLTGLRTNKYNGIVIDYGLEMVTGRIFRLNF